MATNTIELLRADRYGVPLEARCAGCGEVWRRAARDLNASGLVLFSLEHRDCAGELEG
jgi:hypothetical protein